MTLKIFFADDIKRILDALRQAAGRREKNRYRDGYLDALDDAAVAFGVNELAVLHIPVQVPMLEKSSPEVVIVKEKEWSPKLLDQPF